MYYGLYHACYNCWLLQTLYEGIVKNETQYHLVTAQKESLAYRLQLAEEEIKLYLSNDQQDKKKSKRYVHSAILFLCLACFFRCYDNLET